MIHGVFSLRICNIVNMNRLCKYLTILTLLVSTKNLLSQKHLNGFNIAQDHYGFPRNIICDEEGNKYVSGGFSDTVDFDPSNGTYNLIANGLGFDIFLAKYTAYDSLLWAKSMGNFGDDLPLGMTTDDSSNIYLTGYFLDSMDIDLGPDTQFLRPIGNYDIFCIKLNRDGNLVWGKALGSTRDDKGHSIAVDKNYNVYVTGAYGEEMDFDPGPDTFHVDHAKREDLFFLKLTASGDFSWVKTIGGNGIEVGESVNIDSKDRIIVTGSIGTANLTEKFNDTLVEIGHNTAHLIFSVDSNYNLLWFDTLSAKGTIFLRGDIYGGSTTLDTDDNFYLGGKFSKRIDFDPGPDSFFLETITKSRNDFDIFIISLDTNGVLRWTKQIGDEHADFQSGLTANQQNEIIFGGTVKGKVDIDPGADTVLIDTDNNFNGIMVKLNNKGEFIRGHRIPCDNWFSTTCISSSNNLIHYGGSMRGVADIDPSDTVVNIGVKDKTQGFMASLIDCNNTHGNDTVIACHSYKWINGITYQQSTNKAIHAITNQEGCDSIVTLHLTILKPSYRIDSIKACDSFKWVNGITYFKSSDTATVTYKNHVGCDSIVRLYLQMLEPSYYIDSLSACNSYTWINGKTYSTGSHEDTMRMATKNTNGCDSFHILRVRVVKIEKPIVQLSGGVLRCLNADSFDKLSWSFCSSSKVLASGKSLDTFVPSVDSSYKLYAGYQNCTDSSTCIEYKTSGKNKLNLLRFNVYPNPANDVLFIKGSFAVNRVNISNLQGQTMATLKETLPNMYELPANLRGIYFLNIWSNGYVRTIKLSIIK